MSAVDYAVEQIVNGVTDISPYLLQLAFDNPNKGFQDIWGPTNNDYSIEQGIREKIILKMIHPTFNAAGGNTEIIDLSAATIRNLSGGIIAVNVPDFLTGGRRIVSVLNVYPGNLNRAIANGNNFFGSLSCGNGGVMGDAMNRLLGGLDSGQITQTFTNITITGKNSFIIRDAGSAMFNMVAKVILSYDEHFSTIHPKMYDKFAELVELGVKVYIYKNCRRGMQEAVARLGVSVEQLMDDISEYRDAAKDFRQFMEDPIKKYLAYSDPKGVSDTMKMLMPRMR